MLRTQKIFRIFGIDIRIHFSWWFIFILLAWSLSTGLFPQSLPGMTASTYWIMGVLSALLLFISVLLHELSHSLIAKIKKIKVESITLFFFGGVAGIESDDMAPGAEFMMAIAGPLFSLLLAALFYILHLQTGNSIILAMTQYLYQINFILAIFNLVPGFPLDGGRAFRALLYAYYHDLKKATQIAAAGGKVVAGLLVALGLLGFITGAGNGLWFILLGGFLYFLAGMSYEQVVIKEALSQVLVKDIMRTKFPIVDPNTKVEQLFQKYSSGEEDVLVVKGKKFTGLLEFKTLGNISPDVSLQQISRPLGQLKCLHFQDTAYTAFRQLAEQNIDMLPVLAQGKICGVVTKNAVLHRLIWELRSSHLAKRLAHKHQFIKKH